MCVKCQVLLDGDGKPVGGKWSHDADNENHGMGRPLHHQPEFELNDIAREVCDLVDAEFGHHPGQLDRAALRARVRMRLRFGLELALCDVFRSLRGRHEHEDVPFPTNVPA